MKWLFQVVLGGLPLFVALSLQATTYYVATSGSDSNPGSASSPFATLQKGVSTAANPGDVVMVLDGTYGNNGIKAPNYVVTLSHSGNSAAPITIQAQHRGLAVLDSGNTSTTCNGASSYFNLASVSFVVIQGFVIQHGCDSGIQSNNAAHDITLRWNTIQYIANRVSTTQIGLDGIYLNASEFNFTFDGNIFHDIGRTSGTSQNHFDHGIYACAKSLTVINNLFYNMKAGWSIQTCAGAANWLIANNTFAFANTPDNEAGQIMWWGGNSGITVQNNIFYLPNTAAMAQYQASISGSAFASNMVYSVKTIMSSTSGIAVGANQLGVNPNFKSVSVPYDFSLQPGSAAIGAGLTIPAVTTDINGIPRTVPYSLGAYQGGTIPPPPVGPVISQIGANLRIKWTTDQPASSWVEYGPTPTYGSSTTVDPALVTQHYVILPGLTAGTLYHFRCGSANAAGTQTLSVDHTVTAPTVN